MAPLAHPALAFAQRRAQVAVRQAMKRVAQETLRQSGRMLAKVAHASPCVALDGVVATLEQYENLIPLATEALKYAGPLALDVAAFVVVDRLALARPLRPSDFRHPLDERNTALLSVLPGLDFLAKSLLGTAGERVLMLENRGTAIQVGPRQLPTIHRLLLEAVSFWSLA